jgi:hypothetical protein
VGDSRRLEDRVELDHFELELMEIIEEFEDIKGVG